VHPRISADIMIHLIIQENVTLQHMPESGEEVPKLYLLLLPGVAGVALLLIFDFH
jgi:hypothetical protein